MPMSLTVAMAIMHFVDIRFSSFYNPKFSAALAVVCYDRFNRFNHRKEVSGGDGLVTSAPRVVSTRTDEDHPLSARVELQVRRLAELADANLETLPGRMHGETNVATVGTVRDVHDALPRSRLPPRVVRA